MEYVTLPLGLVLPEHQEDIQGVRNLIAHILVLWL